MICKICEVEFFTQSEEDHIVTINDEEVCLKLDFTTHHFRDNIIEDIKIIEENK